MVGVDFLGVSSAVAALEVAKRGLPVPQVNGQAGGRVGFCVAVGCGWLACRVTVVRRVCMKVPGSCGGEGRVRQR